MKAEIISIGTEILLGEITDTNASYLAGQLPMLGIDLYWISQVGDNQARLAEVLQRALQEQWLLIFEHTAQPLAGYLTETENKLAMQALPEWR